MKISKDSNPNSIALPSLRKALQGRTDRAVKKLKYLLQRTIYSIKLDVL